jgi:ectoine hydroxylase-related dioxygenase (phytanoyl-CoA dioxygenase family)
MIDDAMRGQFVSDGVICLRAAIPPRARDLIAAGIARDRAAPGRFFRDQTPEGSPARYLFSYWIWPENPEIAEVARTGPVPALAAGLMRATRAFLLMDNWFLREAGAENGAPWHHDEPYFDFDGGRMCAVWIPLEATSAAEGLSFIRGSHRDFPLLQPKNFKRDQPFEGVGPDYAVAPDFDDPAFDDRRLSWDLTPGDCLVFDLRTVHGATAGRRPLARTIRRLSLRYGDQDVRFRPRGPWTQETAAFLMARGQRADAPLGGAMTPRVWPPAPGGAT